MGNSIFNLPRPRVPQMAKFNPPQAGISNQATQQLLVNPQRNTQGFEPDKGANAVMALNNFLEGFRSTRERAKQKAKDEFYEGLRLMELGIQVDRDKIAKAGKKAGIPLDWEGEVGREKKAQRSGLNKILGAVPRSMGIGQQPPQESSPGMQQLAMQQKMGDAARKFQQEQMQVAGLGVKNEMAVQQQMSKALKSGKPEDWNNLVRVSRAIQLPNDAIYAAGRKIGAPEKKIAQLIYDKEAIPIEALNVRRDELKLNEHVTALDAGFKMAENYPLLPQVAIDYAYARSTGDDLTADRLLSVLQGSKSVGQLTEDYRQAQLGLSKLKVGYDRDLLEYRKRLLGMQASAEAALMQARVSTAVLAADKYRLDVFKAIASAGGAKFQQGATLLKQGQDLNNIEMRHAGVQLMASSLTGMGQLKIEFGGQTFAIGEADAKRRVQSNWFSPNESYIDFGLTPEAQSEIEEKFFSSGDPDSATFGINTKERKAIQSYLKDKYPSLFVIGPAGP